MTLTWKFVVEWTPLENQTVELDPDTFRRLITRIFADSGSTHLDVIFSSFDNLLVRRAIHLHHLPPIFYNTLIFATAKYFLQGYFTGLLIRLCGNTLALDA